MGGREAEGSGANWEKVFNGRPVHSNKKEPSCRSAKLLNIPSQFLSKQTIDGKQFI